MSEAASRDRLSTSRAKVERAEKDAEALRNEFESNRHLIGRYIMVLYCAVISLTLLVLLVHGAFSNGSDFVSAVDLIKTAVLPVVTLVLGYYFGKSELRPGSE